MIKIVATPSTRSVIYASAAHDGHPDMVKLASGNLLCHFASQRLVSGKWSTEQLISTDGGLTFGSLSTVASGSGNNYMFPALLIAASGAILSITVHGGSDNIYDNIQIRTAADAAASSWGAAVVAYDDAGQYIRKPCLTQLPSGRIFCVFQHSRTSEHVDYIYSDDDGATWSTPTLLVGTAESPSVLYHNGLMHVVFDRGGSVYYMASGDSGLTWSDPAVVTVEVQRSSPAVLASNPALVVVGKTIVCVYNAVGVSASVSVIKGIGSNDNGRTWEGVGQIDGTATNTMQLAHALAVDDRDFFVFYDSDESTDRDIILIRATCEQALSGSGWITRRLNRVVDSRKLVSLNSNQFTLKPGSYRFRITAPACGVGRHQARLRNMVTGKSVLGTSEAVPLSGQAQSRSLIIGRIEVRPGDRFEVQHICSSPRQIYGLGRAGDAQDDALYTVAEFWPETAALAPGNADIAPVPRGFNAEQSSWMEEMRQEVIALSAKGSKGYIRLEDRRSPGVQGGGFNA